MDLEAFILIGGRSTRFGRDKAFVEFKGETLAGRVARVVQSAFPDRAIHFVAASENQFGSKIKDLEWPVVYDRRSGFGGWSAVDAALTNSRSEWTLVLACDLPFVTPELLRSLANEESDDVDAVVPRQTDGRLQPLCAFYRTSPAGRAVGDIFAQGGRLPPLVSIFDELTHSVVAAGDDVLRNVNSPADLI
ncbi:MAG TPA: molybdenum cofactor guanylyltransferase [Pyrinomonadaceae bacterium]|nr:molybdenum cofactor guanylyltransferase [Pyrinomonadaceae bacterium]